MAWQCADKKAIWKDRGEAKEVGDISSIDPHKTEAAQGIEKCYVRYESSKNAKCVVWTRLDDDTQQREEVASAWTYPLSNLQR
jgi:hypothetical protein